MAEKKTNNTEINFPCGSLEEMLRVMRKCREKGKIDCETVLEEFMEQDHRNINFSEIKKRLFGNDSKDLNLEEIMKKCRKR